MSDLKDFVIENGVLTKYVGAGGDVVIPDSVNQLGYRAFYKLSKIKEISLPELRESVQGHSRSFLPEISA